MSLGALFGGIGSFFSAAGDYKAASLYGESADVLKEEIPIEKASGQISEAASARQTYKTIGTQIADIAGGGGAESGSALDILRSSRQQGALQQQLIGAQTGIAEIGTQTQVIGAQAEQASANAAGNAAIAAGIGGIASFLFSDKRLKRNVHFVGWYNGFPVWRFRFWWSRRWRLGVIAQQVREIEPALVRRHWTGFLMVDYTGVNDA